MKLLKSIRLPRGTSLVLVATVLLSGAKLPAQSTNTPGRPDLQAFRIISERNIFDPNRSARSNRPPTERREPDRPARTESFSLVGTMNYEKGWFAFFDSNVSDYRKVIEPSGSIAGYTIAEVTPSHVTLQRTNSTPIKLGVGMQMTRREDEDWRVQAPVALTPPTAASGTSQTQALPSAEESEILKKLMQQREQELNK